MEPVVIEDGDYRYRAYRLKSKRNVGMAGLFGVPFEFVVVEWEHPNYGYFADGMFWWRSMHTSEWRPVFVAGWAKGFVGLGDFLREFPRFKGFFGEIVQEPSPMVKALNGMGCGK